MFNICGYNPLVNDDTFNLTYDDILSMNDAEFVSYVQHMRARILKVWDEQGIAPGTGWSEQDVKEEFEQLAGFPTHEMWTTDELTGRRVIHNTYVLGNAVNAWNLSRMLKVRINYSEKDDGRSIYDFFAKDELFGKYLPYARRHFLRDSFYFFSQSIRVGDALPNRESLRAETALRYIASFNEFSRPYGTHEILLEAKAKDKAYSGYAEHLRNAEFLALTLDELKTAKTLLPKVSFRLLKREQLTDDYEFHLRLMTKGQKLFPAMFKSFRVSMCQYAVNFPPLTAQALYNEFCPQQDKVVVWDPSSGWAGRLLGALSSKFDQIHYIGTDPNPAFYEDGPNGTTSVYDAIGSFYTGLRGGDSLFDEAQTWEVHKTGSERANKLFSFLRHKGKGDLVFTSPPYFNREAYSEDANQSYKKFSTYESWRDGFLRPTLQNAYDFLNHDRYLLWNIADLKVGKKFLPLEQDSIAIAQELGFTHTETILMSLRGMPGANRVTEDGEATAKNFCKVKGRLLKFEPVHVFHKA